MKFLLFVEAKNLVNFLFYKKCKKNALFLLKKCKFLLSGETQILIKFYKKCKKHFFLLKRCRKKKFSKLL